MVLSGVFINTVQEEPVAEDLTGAYANRRRMRGVTEKGFFSVIPVRKDTVRRL